MLYSILNSIQTVHQTFLKSRHPEVTKTQYCFVHPPEPKTHFLGSSSWTKTNKDHQKTIKDKYQRLPKEHYRSFAITTDTEEDRNGESKKNVTCWLCHECHKVSDCQTLKNMSVQERRETVKRKGLYFNCLSNTHQIGNCKPKVSCKIKGCGKRHNTILHNVNYKPSPNSADSTDDSQNKQQQENQQNHQDQQVINSHQSTISKRLFLQILPVTLKHSNKTVTVNADSGLDTTIISENVATIC